MAFDVEGARKAGYTDAEIAYHLAKAEKFDLDGAKKSGYTDSEVIAHLAGGNVDPAMKLAAAIPGTDPAWAAGKTPAQNKPDPTLADRAIGAGEAALSTATGMTTGLAGQWAGAAKGLAQAILDGSFGTPQAADMVEKSIQQGGQSLTYAPRTDQGQQQAQAVGDAMAAALPAVMVAPGMVPRPAGAAPFQAPAGVLARAGIEGTARDVVNAVVKPAEMAGLVAPGAAGEVAAAGAQAATSAAVGGAQRVAGLAKGVTTLPRRAVAALKGEAEQPTPGTMASAGSAGTDMATQRVQAAQDLGFTGDAALTRGQATRDPAQSKFEVETAKLPDQGQTLRERFLNQNDQALRTFDDFIDRTGTTAPTLRTVGQSVDKALTEQYARDKAQVRGAYKAAEKAGEMEAPITLDSVIQHLNESGPEAATAPLLDVARRKALQLKIAVEGPDGTLQPAPVPLKTAEALRQSIGQATDYAPTNIRQSAILKGLIDESTDGMGGTLYKQARATRARLAQNYEDRAVVSKLLNNKRGTSDRAVALEDVFDHSVLKGSLDDVRNVRRVLHRGGADGAQAWRDLQGATMQWLKDEATKNVATDSRGNRVISASAVDKAVRSLDVDGRLDFIFGKKGAQQLRDLRDLTQYIKTVPPEAAVNLSNTAVTLMAFGDILASGITGTPAPILTGGRMGLKYIKDRALRKRIQDALDATLPKQAPGKPKPARHAPSRNIH